VTSDERHVLIAGGGVAALEAALALRTLAEGRVRVELLAPEPQFWYRPSAVAEPFGRGEVRHFDLADLAEEIGAAFTLGQLVSVDAARRLAYTSPGGAVHYGTLLVAVGASPTIAVRGALTFRGPADTTRIEELLADIEAGRVHHVAFAVPTGAVWSLPAYELALMTAAWVAERNVPDVGLTVVTPEASPLQLFGAAASDAVAALLERRGIALHTGAYAAEARTGELLLVGEEIIPVDRVVALPRLQGPRIGGIPQTFEGFVPVDAHGRVTGLEDVFAAGDITTFGVKQGGIAAQQAEAAAEAIAAHAGAPLDPRPFQPVLRGLLLTGAEPRYLHSELASGGTSWASTEPLWWPPAKIVGRYLSPFLARASGAEGQPEPPPDGIAVEIPLDASVEARRDRLIAAAVEDALHESTVTRVDDVISGDPLLVAPEDTLGEVAERMVELGTDAALVAEYGRLIGILTAQDMLHALAGRVHSSEARVRPWMTAEPITATADMSLDAAAVLMVEHDVHHLPVVDGERPVGIVGIREVLRSNPSYAEGHANVGLGF
jgi:sulfide:quinone oxidoreductase